MTKPIRSTSTRWQPGQSGNPNGRPLKALTRSFLDDCGPVKILSTQNGVMARITCANCDMHEEWVVGRSLPSPEIICKHFSQRHWRITKRATCPACQSHKSKETPAMTATNVTAISTPKPEPTDRNNPTRAEGSG